MDIHVLFKMVHSLFAYPRNTGLDVDIDELCEKLTDSLGGPADVGHAAMLCCIST